MVRTIIFDFGGVLGSDSNDFGGELLKVTGLSLKEINKIYILHSKKLNLGKENLSYFWKDVYKLSKEKVKISTLQKIYESDISINSSILKFAKEMKEKGFDVIILSDESKEGMNIKIKKFKLNNIFSKIYCSSFLGMAKPDKKIFKYVLKDLNLKSNEVIFIDDRKENINIANKLGIKSILFRNLNQLKREIN